MDILENEVQKMKLDAMALDIVTKRIVGDKVSTKEIAALKKAYKDYREGYKKLYGADNITGNKN